MWKYILIVVALLAVPVVPFLLFGEPMENRMETWLRSRDSFGAVAWGVVVLLSVDVLLPVPSSIVCTLAGSFLGLVWGTFFSTLGMTLGALLGFGLGRRLGRPAMTRFVKEDELRRLDRWVDRFGLPILVLLRPVPLFAEASTLLLGCSTMRGTVFFAATVPIHLILSVVYATLGTYLSLPVAVALSVVLALGLSLGAQRLLKY